MAKLKNVVHSTNDININKDYRNLSSILKIVVKLEY